MLDPSAPLGARDPFVYDRRALESRIRAVLQTRPGDLPWRPTFGCDLAKAVGRSASDRVLEEARSSVRRALRQWVPEVRVQRVTLRVHTPPGAAPLAVQGLPVAETALFTLGTQAWLDIEVEAVAEAGLLRVREEVRA